VSVLLLVVEVGLVPVERCFEVRDADHDVVERAVHTGIRRTRTAKSVLDVPRECRQQSGFESDTSRSRGPANVTEYDATLFDSDGVLVEPPTSETKIEATRAAFREVGVADPDPDHVHTVVDGPTVDDLHAVCDAYDLDPGTFWAAREDCDERSQFAAFRSGDRDRYEDVAAIEAVPHARGVVSNNHHSTIEFKLDFFGLEPLFDTHYGREKTIESLELKKPNTHYLDRALSDLGAETAVYVGDSESDVLAAHRAGLDSVFVRRDRSRGVELSVAPTHEVNSLRGVVDLVS
jgi:HAD superfamily hydrolase (TIGR01549 family)